MQTVCLIHTVGASYCQHGQYLIAFVLHVSLFRITIAVVRPGVAARSSRTTKQLLGCMFFCPIFFVQR